jgi:putative addiction module component (TIGR02574 family)
MSNATTSVDDAFLLAQSLPPADKLQLISRLWDNIRLGGGFRPSDSDLREMQRRSAEFDAGKVKGIPWEEVWADIERQMDDNHSN